MNKDTTQIFMTELDTYLFGQGTHYEIYNKMGAHLAVKNGKEGVYFVVWAPKAKEVYVVGDFNDWRAYGYDMKPVSDGGVYELFVEGAKAGQCYKFLIISQDGEALYKADPYANAAQLRPETASVIKICVVSLFIKSTLPSYIFICSIYTSYALFVLLSPSSTHVFQYE